MSADVAWEIKEYAPRLKHIKIETLENRRNAVDLLF